MKFLFKRFVLFFKWIGLLIMLLVFIIKIKNVLIVRLVIWLDIKNG